ncbi:MAG: hypothetical protein GY754_15950 [bacterium]|nr:hypothetical protein [bacterium]
MNKMSNVLVLIVLILGMSLLACSDMIRVGMESLNPLNKESSKIIVYFYFEAEKNDGLNEDIIASISGSKITAYVPDPAAPSVLTATFKINGVSTSVNGLEQKSGLTENDFSSELVYVVTAENGSKQEYTVGITREPDPMQQFGSEGDDEAVDIAIDSNGNSYVVGWIEGRLGAIESKGGSDICLIKYNLSGGREWVRTFGGAGQDYARAVALDSDGNIYIAGSVDGNLESKNGIGEEDAVLIKCNPLGELIRTSRLGSGKGDYATGLAIDADNNITVVGNTRGAMAGASSNGGLDFFLARYNTAGGLIWVRQYGSTENDYVQDVETGNNGFFYCTGYTDGKLEAGDMPGVRDMFLALYDSAGIEQWMKQVGTDAADEGHSVAVDSEGSCYIAGWTSGSFSSTENSGGADMLLIKYDSTGDRKWIRQPGTSLDDYAYGAAVGLSGGVFIVGNSRESENDTEQETGRKTMTLPGNDLNLAYYSSDGYVLDSQQYGSTEAADYGRGIAVNSNGLVHIAGFTEGDVDGYSSQGGTDLLFINYTIAPPGS